MSLIEKLETENTLKRAEEKISSPAGPLPCPTCHRIESWLDGYNRWHCWWCNMPPVLSLVRSLHPEFPPIVSMEKDSGEKSQIEFEIDGELISWIDPHTNSRITTYRGFERSWRYAPFESFPHHSSHYTPAEFYAERSMIQVGNDSSKSNATSNGPAVSLETLREPRTGKVPRSRRNAGEAKGRALIDV
jgi:hypothetical protein